MDFNHLTRIWSNSITKNFLALGLMQATNYLLPLLFVPYIIRIIDIEKFGAISFSQAIMGFLAVIADYGFNLTSTREVSLHRNNKRKISRIYSVAMCVKLLLGVSVFIALLVCVFLVPKLNEERVLHLSAFTIVLGQIFLPVWLFQGLEKMQYITMINFISKVITMAFVLLFIQSKPDYIYVLPCYASGACIVTILTLIWISKVMKIRLMWVSFRDIRKQLNRNFALFVSNASVSFYSSTTIVILGIFASDTVVGYYSAAEKIMLVPRQLLSVFSQAIYPKVCLLAGDGYASLQKLWRKLMPAFIALVFIFCLSIFLLSDQLALFLTGQTSAHISTLIKLLAFVPFLVSLNIQSYQTLLAFGRNKECLKVLAAASIISVVLNFLLSRSFQAVGTSVALLITEAIIAGGLYWFFLNTRIKNQINSSYKLKI